jgi:peptidoglycan biosynthesis protein MviN/MurJ (putative lipid II flippase)
MDTGMLGLGIGGGLIVYIYMALCLMFIAQKTNTAYPWLAWIPVANVFLMAMIAKKPWWWALIMVLAYGIAAAVLNSGAGWLGWILYIVGIIFTILIWIGICQARNRPRWWVVLLFIPIINLVIIGILAFSKK